MHSIELPASSYLIHGEVQAEQDGFPKYVAQDVGFWHAPFPDLRPHGRVIVQKL